MLVFILASCASHKKSIIKTTLADHKNNAEIEVINFIDQPALIPPQTSSIAKISAWLSVFFSEFIATDSAQIELEKFRKGNQPSIPIVFDLQSVATKELLSGDYYQSLNHFLIDSMAQWYGGKIPHSGGLFIQDKRFRPFGPTDAFTEFFNGIDMADIIGTITYFVRMTTEDGVIHFFAVNKMSLESFAGENYLRHGLVENPTQGSFTSTTQIFKWQLAIPNQYQSNIDTQNNNENN